MTQQEGIPYTKEEVEAMVKTIQQLRKDKKELVDRVCEWLEYQMHNTHNGIKVNNKNPSVGVLLYNLRKAVEDKL